MQIEKLLKRIYRFILTNRGICVKLKKKISKLSILFKNMNLCILHFVNP